ncbi:MAG: zf-HC2 domain-containing protein [Candidatus Eisenbacteria bacterium]|nr:zf-HC2 domain-containing protein [Candidatus Eisenbacteria bacterium]
MDTKSKTCKKTRDWFSSYYDGVLSKNDSSRFDEHLRACPSCKSSYDRFTALLRGARTLPRVRTGPEFEARLFARIRAERSAPARVSWWQELARIPLPVPIGAAAVVLLAVFAYTRVGVDRAPAPAPSGAPAETVSRPSGADDVPIRTNTRPSFLDGFERGSDMGRVVGIDLHGPPYPGDVHPRTAVFVAPCDLNGVPLEGPYEPVLVEPGTRARRGPNADTSGAVDTFTSR